MVVGFYSSGKKKTYVLSLQSSTPIYLKKNPKNVSLIKILCCFKIAKATLVITKPQHMY